MSDTIIFPNVQQLHRHPATADLNIRQAEFLRLVYVAGGPSTIRGLTAALGIPKSAVVRTADKFEVAKIIKRTKDKKDARNVWIDLTATGRTLIEHVTIGKLPKPPKPVVAAEPVKKAA